MVDTTTCRPAYHIAQPCEGMEAFPVRRYDLTGGGGSGSRLDLGKVEQYWYDLQPQISCPIPIAIKLQLWDLFLYMPCKYFFLLCDLWKILIDAIFKDLGVVFD